MPRCLLHNTKKCSREKSLANASKDNRVRVVYGYDWSTTSDNPALLYEEVDKVFKELQPTFPDLKFRFERLGGKQGSIYCDICRQIQSADIALFDISTHNLNVIFELGLAAGTGTNVFILRSNRSPRLPRDLSDLNGILEYRFARRQGRLNFEADLSLRLKAKLKSVAKRRMKILGVS